MSLHALKQQFFLHARIPLEELAEQLEKDFIKNKLKTAGARDLVDFMRHDTVIALVREIGKTENDHSMQKIVGFLDSQYFNELVRREAFLVSAYQSQITQNVRRMLAGAYQQGALETPKLQKILGDRRSQKSSVRTNWRDFLQWIEKEFKANLT